MWNGSKELKVNLISGVVGAMQRVRFSPGEWKRGEDIGNVGYLVGLVIVVLWIPT